MTYATMGRVTDHKARLAEAAEEYRRSLAARENLIKAIRAAHAAEIRQIDILRATDHVWTREQVRRICQEDGQ